MFLTPLFPYFPEVLAPQKLNSEKIKMTEKTIEGIFEVISECKDGCFEDSKLTEGKVISIKELPYRDVKGITLDIQNERGMGKINFPRNIYFVRKFLIDQRIRYAEKVTSIRMDGELATYVLEILSGQLKGEKLTERGFGISGY